MRDAGVGAAAGLRAATAILAMYNLGVRVLMSSSGLWSGSTTDDGAGAQNVAPECYSSYHNELPSKHNTHFFTVFYSSPSSAAIAASATFDRATTGWNRFCSKLVCISAHSSALGLIRMSP